MLRGINIKDSTVGTHRDVEDVFKLHTLGRLLVGACDLRRHPGRQRFSRARLAGARVMLPSAMLDLATTHDQLARPWTPAELAAHYRNANRDEERTPGTDRDDDAIPTSIALLASAIPPASSLNVAIHVLHVMPSTAGGEQVTQQLLSTVD